jgi:hypothetical protein
VDEPPVGIWSTTLGTADALMQDVLCLQPDGTGYLRSESAMHGIEEFPIMWKHVQAGRLQITTLMPGDDPQAEPLWETIHYCWDEIENDTGERVHVLRNTADDHFWTLPGPVRFVSAVSNP